MTLKAPMLIIMGCNQKQR